MADKKSKISGAQTQTQAAPEPQQAPVQEPKKISKPFSERAFAHVRNNNMIIPHQASGCGQVMIRMWHCLPQSEQQAEFLAKHREFLEFPRERVNDFVGLCKTEASERGKVAPHRNARMVM